MLTPHAQACTDIVVSYQHTAPACGMTTYKQSLDRICWGCVGQCVQARDIQSGELMAVKVYNLPQLGELNKVQLIREIRLHGSFAHRNIIELYVAFQVCTTWSFHNWPQQSAITISAQAQLQPQLFFLLGLTKTDGWLKEIVRIL